MSTMMGYAFNRRSVLQFSVGLITLLILVYWYYRMGEHTSEQKYPGLLPIEKLERRKELNDYNVMVAILITDEEIGYTHFTSAVFAKVLQIPGVNIQVFGKTMAKRNLDEVARNYGKDASFHSLESVSLVEAIIDIFKHFQASKFEALLTLTSDMVISTKALEFTSSKILSSDVLRLFRNRTECKPAGDELCIDTSPVVIGSAMKRTLVNILLNHVSALRQVDHYNIAIQQNNIKSYVSQESFILSIRQTFEADGCKEYFPTYNFNRCSFPMWVQRGIEFYLDKCNKPTAIFDENSEDKGFYSKPVVSYSLYGGDNRRYTDGAIANSDLMYSIYPEWRMWVYHDDSLPSDILKTMCQRNVKLIHMSRTKFINEMTWRFLVASEPVHRYIIRDIDSRLSMRERHAVYEWIDSGKKFHVMRDHPAHSNYAMSGGMWGGVHDAIPSMRNMIENYSLSKSYLQDMNFLNDKVWPIVKESVWQNDAFPNGEYGLVHPFPSPRVGLEQVGSVYVNGVPRDYDVEILRKALEKLNKK